MMKRAKLRHAPVPLTVEDTWWHHVRYCTRYEACRNIGCTKLCQLCMNQPFIVCHVQILVLNAQQAHVALCLRHFVQQVHGSCKWPLSPDCCISAYWLRNPTSGCSCSKLTLTSNLYPLDADQPGPHYILVRLILIAGCFADINMWCNHCARLQIVSSNRSCKI